MYNDISPEMIYDRYTQMIDFRRAPDAYRERFKNLDNDDPHFYNAAFTREDIADISNGLELRRFGENGWPVRHGGFALPGTVNYGSYWGWSDFLSINGDDRAAIFTKSIVPFYEEQKANDAYHGNGTFEMYQKADEGLYILHISDYRREENGKMVFFGNEHKLQFFSNEEINAIWPAGCENYKDGFVTLDQDIIVTTHRSYMHPEERFLRYGFGNTNDVTETDMFRAFNSIYKLGLPKLYEMMAQPDFDIGVVLGDKKELSQSLAEGERLFEGGTDLDKVEAFLTQCRELGIELTEKQQMQLAAIQKLKPYRAAQPEREAAQLRAKEEVARKNQEKYDWWENEANPSNIHQAELQSMFETATKERDFLEQVDQNNMRSFLTQDQAKGLEESSEFLRMMDEADAANKSYGDEMSPEVRAWYQEHYSKQESESSSHKM